MLSRKKKKINKLKKNAAFLEFLEYLGAFVLYQLQEEDGRLLGLLSASQLNYANVLSLTVSSL